MALPPVVFQMIGQVVDLPDQMGRVVGHLVLAMATESTTSSDLAEGVQAHIQQHSQVNQVYST